ncbi:MAG: hypothetical protein DMG14_31795 [Acidobacteria bacterium]|nr:MAG: hypothetical protein DMG14_31795 [Acidobacteriota bacterium]
MTAKQKTVIGLVMLVLVFLLGFMPQYLEKRQLQRELAISIEKLKLSELRDLAGLMLLEGLRQNYGVARDYSSQYFDKLREISEQAENSTLKAALQELLSSRDAVTAALSKADPASASQLQAIFAKTQTATKAQP